MGFVNEMAEVRRMFGLKKKGLPAMPEGLCNDRIVNVAPRLRCRNGHFHNIGGLRPFRALDDIKFDVLSLL